MPKYYYYKSDKSIIIYKLNDNDKNHRLIIGKYIKNNSTKNYDLDLSYTSFSYSMPPTNYSPGVVVNNNPVPVPNEVKAAIDEANDEETGKMPDVLLSTYFEGSFFGFGIKTKRHKRTRRTKRNKKTRRHKRNKRTKRYKKIVEELG